VDAARDRQRKPGRRRGRLGIAAPPWPAASAGQGGGIYNRSVVTIVLSATTDNRAGYSGEVHALQSMVHDWGDPQPSLKVCDPLTFIVRVIWVLS